MNTHVINKTDIVLCSLAPTWADRESGGFLVWIDTENDLLCFDGRRIRLDALDHDDRATLRHISMLRDYAPTSEFYNACERELMPLISKLWRLTTN